MASSLRADLSKTLQNSVPSSSAHMAKAELRSHATLAELADVMKTASRVAHGKQENAASTLGRTPGNLSLAMSSGELKAKDMAALGDAFLAEVGRELVSRFGPLASPKQHGKRLVREARAMLDELDQLIDSEVA